MKLPQPEFFIMASMAAGMLCLGSGILWQRPSLIIAGAALLMPYVAIIAILIGVAAWRQFFDRKSD